MLRASSHWTSQISYEAIALLILTQFLFDVLMRFYYIDVEYNGPLEAVNAFIHDGRYIIVD